ncbi:MAG: TPM domain-containing protein [Gallionella sp.]|nr:TPM domain-containing protein [Gallionella sp.]MDD4946495.1 TPM domain-containing protein [Gallionella sp.]MDD5612944.1 TPM domain-containing protein [Gallionella sp.]
MNLKRVIRHLSSGQATVRRVFPASAMGTIEAATGVAEARHDGQIRFAVEAALELSPLLSGQTARQRAIEVFAQLRVWDTEHNNGVLIYLLLADRKVEIVADRGIHARLGQSVWERICRNMEAEFRAGRFESGVLAGIQEVGDHLSLHFPARVGKPNEMPDAPVIL